MENTTPGSSGSDCYFYQGMYPTSSDAQTYPQPSFTNLNYPTRIELPTVSNYQYTSQAPGVSYPSEYAGQTEYYTTPTDTGPGCYSYFPETGDTTPVDRDANIQLMEEFIMKCNSKKKISRPPSPPLRRRSRSRSRSRNSSRSRKRSRSKERSRPTIRSPRRSTSRGRCFDRPAPLFRPKSRTSRRSKSRESCRGKERSISSERSVSSTEFTQKSKRKELLDRWRLNNCSTSNEMSDQLEEISKMKPEDIIEKEKNFWTRTAPADLYYVRCDDNPKVSKGTEKLINLCDKFDFELVKRSARAKEGKPAYEMPHRRNKVHHHKCCATNSGSDSDTESGEYSGDEEDEGLLEELERKKAHPDRLHPELWYNDPGEMNDGPLCRCSAKAKRSGIRHNIYAGELNLEKCDVFTNNADRLHHYRITVSPPTNFLIKTPTIIEHDNHEYIFEGFSMLSHKPLENLPVCKVIRFNIEYTILYIEEKLPEHFIIRELDLFYEYLFKEILELVDLDFKAAGDSDGCSQFHFMPRFVRELPENGKELLSMNQVLIHLLASSKPLIAMDNLREIINLSNYKWQNYVDDVKGMVVTYPGKKPCSLRVDQLDRDQSDAKPGEVTVPEIVHFGIRPPQLSYAGNPEYQKAWREYVKFRHLLANMPKASFEDKRKLEMKENKLQEMRTQSKMKRDVTIAISAEGFYRSGIMCDIVQHAMLIPVLVSHLRFHRSLDVLETDIGYTFKNRSLLQLALTHPSYRENFGTNPDHARNSLTNCSIRQPEYGDRRIHYLNTRKRGINTLINIMSRFGKKYETESNITHNERLEFLGDAVVEFITSIHLFHLFPRLEEGGLATYRAAIVQNQHLAVLAKKLGLDGYMLYAHGSDLCHDLELRHAMANCFEALMGALFLDGNIEAADKVFGESLFKESSVHLAVWVDYPQHPLQEQEPNGDRQWISKFKILQDLTVFEDSIGVQFTHIRLLARAFTDRSIGYTNLTLGSNQRLEFLGDTVLQLIASDYLYKYFPEHHEGHLSLLRSSLVNNRTQAVVCDDLGIATYAIYANPKAELKTKDRADLLEAFLGALYVDKGLQYCETFCNVCFFPRLHHFIMHQDWNDPKSKLQQCCLTLRTMEGGEPEIPIYKVIECMGPTNTRLYTVAVYFKGKRLAQATGHSIQQAEMNAAKEALENSQKLFPQLDHQKRVIAKSIKQDPPLFDRDGKRIPSRSENKESRNPSKRANLNGIQGQRSRESSSSRSITSNSRSTGIRSPTQERIKDRSRSVSNSYEGAKYRRGQQESERGSREPSCRSERSQSVRSNRSPAQKRRDDDHYKRDITRGTSPKNKSKDDSNKGNQNIKSSKTLEEVITGKYNSRSNIAERSEKRRNVGTDRNARSPSLEYTRKDDKESLHADKLESNSRGTRSPSSNGKNREIRSKDDEGTRSSKSKCQEERSQSYNDRKETIDLNKTNEADSGPKDDRQKKKRSCSKDSEDRCIKRKRDDCRGRTSSSSEDRFQMDEPGETEDRKLSSSHEQYRTKEQVTEKMKTDQRPKRRIPSDEGEIFSTSSSSPKENDESSRDSVMS
ncbi:hypothetical protein GE061_010342 [Apolygus lucorum]|uniref:Ribonuclease 3 n=1 Tax=Apolygus lucorum TaxID=248454 RepID=A0A8S9Y5G4_APOLU|nr:hypothetical protein GE061_010342 [Apolygus lucorum]